MEYKFENLDNNSLSSYNNQMFIQARDPNILLFPSMRWKEKNVLNLLHEGAAFAILHDRMKTWIEWNHGIWVSTFISIENRFQNTLNILFKKSALKGFLDYE